MDKVSELNDFQILQPTCWALETFTNSDYAKSNQLKTYSNRVGWGNWQYTSKIVMEWSIWWVLILERDLNIAKNWD